MDKRIVAVGVVAMLVIVAAGAVVLSNNQPRGWYAWGPTVSEVEYSEISTTPEIIDSLTSMYYAVYGNVPGIGTGALEYPSLVTDTAAGIEVVSAMSATSGNTKHTGKVSFTSAELENLKIISYGSGFTDCLVELLGDSVWSKVVAAGNTTYDRYPDNGMENWSTSGNGTLGSEYILSTENITSYLEYTNAKDSGDTYCLVMWGYVKNYDVIHDSIEALGYKNVKMLCVDYYSITNIEGILSVMDVMGRLAGVSSEDNKSIYMFQSRLSGIIESLDGKAPVKTVYLERADGKSPGSGTLAQACFDILKMTNINTSEGTTKVSDETVVSSRPDVIFFATEDERTMDQKMRVTV
jgi:ABC-type Fe3+-hydroxamate transport system substrate-binding protein